MGRYRSRSRGRSYSPRRSKRYGDPRDSRRSRRDRRSPAPSGLLVRNISLDVRPENLRISFERFGPIKDIYLPKDYYTGEPRGFGFVKYLHPEDAADAKERLNHTVIGGREIQIVFAEENRKTPQEMRRMSHISERGSYRRRSPVRSPRHRYHSYSRSPSPSRSGTRFLSEKETLKEFRLIKTETKFIKSRLLAYIFDEASTELKKEYRACSWPKKESTSKIGTDRDRVRRTRDDRYSPSRSRSVSRSVSPRYERNYRSKQKSPRRSRSISRSPSPHEKRNYRSPIGNGQSPNDERDHEPSVSPSPDGKLRSPRNYRSRSYSPS